MIYVYNSLLWEYKGGENLEQKKLCFTNLSTTRFFNNSGYALVNKGQYVLLI